MMIITIINLIMNFIVTNLRELIMDVAKATMIEKVIMIGLWLIPIPMTLEAYLIVKRIIRKKVA